MSLVTRGVSEAEKYPELAGSRVVITGLTSTCGVALAQAFAERKARLLIQTPDRSRDIGAKKRLLAKSAAELIFLETPFNAKETPTHFAQSVARTFGSIDTLVNLVSVNRLECLGMHDLDQIENLIIKKLSAIREITEVTANRMALTWSEGQILNALLLFVPKNKEEVALLGLLKSTLAAMTRDQAQRWADSAVRINAVAPQITNAKHPCEGCGTSSEADLAAFALFLASHKGRKLTGHIFESEGVAGETC